MSFITSCLYVLSLIFAGFTLSSTILIITGRTTSCGLRLEVCPRRNKAQPEERSMMMTMSYRMRKARRANNRSSCLDTTWKLARTTDNRARVTQISRIVNAQRDVLAFVIFHHSIP